MEQAIETGLSLIGTPYKYWYNGDLSDNAPSWNGSGKPNIDIVKKEGLFCAGLTNIMLRSIGLDVPKFPPYNGGTYSYGINYKLYQFKLEDVRRGDVLFRMYKDVNDQGHIAVALGDCNNYVLQCFSEGNGSPNPGVNIDYTVIESHAG
jgi:hypothetical protein